MSSTEHQSIVRRAIATIDPELSTETNWESVQNYIMLLGPVELVHIRKEILESIRYYYSKLKGLKKLRDYAAFRSFLVSGESTSPYPCPVLISRDQNEVFDELLRMSQVDNLRAVVFVDGDNARTSMDILRIIAGNRFSIPVLFTIAKDMIYCQIIGCDHLPWFSLLETVSRVKDAADHFITFQIGILHALLPRHVEFLIVSNGGFTREVKATCDSHERRCVLVDPESTDIGIFLLFRYPDAN